MGGLSCNMVGFRRLEIPVKSCRISKSDLQFYNGCKMLKQVQHDKFYGELASPLRGEGYAIVKKRHLWNVTNTALLNISSPALRHTCYSAKHTARLPLVLRVVLYRFMSVERKLR